FGRLIALPSVKLNPGNLYNDIKIQPTNGSPSISERKVATFLEANAPLAAYTATRIVKSFPSGIRQDSSNMDPMPSVGHLYTKSRHSNQILMSFNWNWGFGIQKVLF
uniref:PI-PLC Y-box domain-containing protein n=1 Tax=Globodera pallida TaxID=36090 RepID=A0A183CT12_GLOPA